MLEVTNGIAVYLLGWIVRCFIKRDILKGNVLDVFDLSPKDGILVLAPHPDDESAGMGGTINQLQEYGVKVFVALLTDGSLSTAGELKNKSIEQRAAVRYLEFQSATKFLGEKIITIGPFAQELPEWPSNGQLHQHCESLSKYLNDENIKYIFSPPANDFHPHHRATAWIAKNLAVKLYSTPKVICYEVQAPFRILQFELLVRLRKNDIENKCQAIHSYRSQEHTLATIFRLDKLRQRFDFEKSPVEAFWYLKQMDNELPLTHGMTQSPLKDLALLFRCNRTNSKKK